MFIKGKNKVLYQTIIKNHLLFFNDFTLLARWRHYRRLKEITIFAAVARRERKRDAATSPSRRSLGARRTTAYIAIKTLKETYIIIEHIKKVK